MPFATLTVLEALDAEGELVAVRGALPSRFSDLTDDSRRVRSGALFAAMRGASTDGHAYLGDAERAGAAAAIVQGRADTDLPCFVVRDGRRSATVAARAAFGDPAASLTMVGVTGTNGKTTTADILRHLLQDDSSPAASVGTLGVLLGSDGEAMPGAVSLTTPGLIDLQRTLRSLVDRGVARVVMEVSSHSLQQERVRGLRFDAAIFTNISRDHLDYHGTMESYVAAKARLLDHLAPAGVAVVNADDAAWRVLPSAGRRVTFGVMSAADLTADQVQRTTEGSRWLLAAGDDREPVALPLLGAFNVANALGAAACAWSLGLPLSRVAERLGTVRQVPGRLERLLAQPAVLRDYAHTPDALERALGAVRPFVRGRLIVVFGCGGDRDRGKRPQMGAVAESQADVVILTSDNPRTEDPERILDEIEAGMSLRSHERIEDRRAAIARAMRLAAQGVGDLVLLAGKGHETYQIRGTTSFPFDERVVVAELAAARPAGSA
ncbi:MAG TPA: UDP-N-acetylmuramoyl-L-alanyl-D-glutamate--2,6-diaminopimelate ligase [Gemmatimonadaceae bacterium]